MKKINYGFLIGVTLLMACSASKKMVKADAPVTAAATSAAKVVQDGSSFENAVIVEAQSETQGIKAEHVWINEHYPGAKTQSQSLVNKEKKAYDILKIVTADGTTKSIYFNITNFFGKF